MRELMRPRKSFAQKALSYFLEELKRSPYSYLPWLLLSLAWPCGLGPKTPGETTVPPGTRNRIQGGVDVCVVGEDASTSLSLLLRVLCPANLRQEESIS